MDEECVTRGDCDWPRDRSRIISELDRLKGGEAQSTAIVKQLIELTVEVRNLNEKITRLAADGTSYAHKEVESIREILSSHALELREQKVRQSALAVFFGVMGGAVSSLVGWLVHSRG